MIPSTPSTMNFMERAYREGSAGLARLEESTRRMQELPTNNQERTRQDRYEKNHHRLKTNIAALTQKIMSEQDVSRGTAREMLRLVALDRRVATEAEPEPKPRPPELALDLTAWWDAPGALDIGAKSANE